MKEGTASQGPWTHDPEHSLLRGDVAVRVLVELGVMNAAEAQRMTARLLAAHEQAESKVRP